MTWDQVAARWPQFTASFQSVFHRLARNEAEAAGGVKENLIALLCQRYGIALVDADLQLEQWRESLAAGEEIPTSTSGDPTY